MPWADRPGHAWVALRLTTNLVVFAVVYCAAMVPLARGMGM
jgi:hypothetical protein